MSENNVRGPEDTPTHFNRVEKLNSDQEVLKFEKELIDIQLRYEQRLAEGQNAQESKKIVKKETEELNKKITDSLTAKNNIDNPI